MIGTIVVDDEWYNLEEISDLIEKTGFMKVEGRCQNAAEALQAAARALPQVAFIDIEMPEMDGLTLAEKLLELYPAIKIVFITGWNQYAVAAFELNALDYIMKPINISRFNKMVDRLKSEIGLEESRPNALKISCFGRLEVLANDRPVIWQRTKAEELFAFLLTNHDAYIHKEIIIENLWPNIEYTKALPILQTSVCKIRNVLSPFKKNVELIYADNKYGLFLSKVNCDYFEVENVLSNYNREKEETYQAVEAACTLCCKGFLSQNGYVWSVPMDEALRSRAYATLRDIAVKYIELGKMEKALPLLRRLARLSPTDDDSQILYLGVLQARGLIAEISLHCKWLSETLHQDYDSELPQAVSGFLEQIQTVS